jgi:hypothetical protein
MFGSLLCGLFDSLLSCWNISSLKNSNLPKFLSQMGDYSYCTFKNGRLRTRGLYHHGFPLLLWDALVQTGYGDRAPEYYCRLSEEHGL